MDKMIIAEVGEQLKELTKDTAKTVVEQVGLTGKEFFQAMLGISESAKMTDEELNKKKKEEEEEKQKLLSQHRKMLKELAADTGQPPETAYAQKMKEEHWKKERQVEMAKQKQQMQLPTITPKPQRGSLFAFKKRKQAQVELGKTPGQ